MLRGYHVAISPARLMAAETWHNRLNISPQGSPSCMHDHSMHTVRTTSLACRVYVFQRHSSQAATPKDLNLQNYGMIW
jgi:hypothetical protein